MKRLLRVFTARVEYHRVPATTGTCRRPFCGLPIKRCETKGRHQCSGWVHEGMGEHLCPDGMHRHETAEPEQGGVLS